MKIAILVSSLPPESVGGAERQAAQVASRLAPRHAVRIFTRTTTIPPELRSLPDGAVTRRCHVNVRGLRFFADILETLARIGRERDSIDVILAYQTVIDGVIGVAARILFGIPVIVSVRNETEYQLDRFVQSRLFSPFVFRHADRIAVQSPALGEGLVRALDRPGRRPTTSELRAKLFVLANGMTGVSPRQAEGQGVLYVGRLTRIKSVDVLIEAMRELPDERLTIVGDGPERQALERAARGLANVSFTGAVEHARVSELLERAGVLVLPSLQEGQPNVIMEAMARGVPVVATAVGGVPDLVLHNETGWLTKPGDAPAIAEGIRRLSADAELRARLAANGVREMHKYEWPNVLGALERTLVDVVSSRRKSDGMSAARNQ